MITALLIAAALLLVIVGCLAAYWRGMLTAATRIPTSTQIMREMQQTYTVAMEAITGEVARAPVVIDAAAVPVPVRHSRRRQAPPGAWRIGLTDDEIREELAKRRAIYDAVNQIPNYYWSEWQRRKNAV